MEDRLKDVMGPDGADLFRGEHTCAGADGQAAADRRSCCWTRRAAICSAGPRTWAWAGRPDRLHGREVLILGTQGGIRNEDGTPVALGYHTGHWEIGLLMKAAAAEIAETGGIPFAGSCQRSVRRAFAGDDGHVRFAALPQRCSHGLAPADPFAARPSGRHGRCDLRQGAAGHDDGAWPACASLPGVIVPGGVTLPPTNGEDAGKIQTIGARYAHGEMSLEEAADLGCRACATPGGGCQFLGTAATAQVVAEALGMSCRMPRWRRRASRSGRRWRANPPGRSWRLKQGHHS